MSKEFYDASMDYLEKIIDGSHYEKIILGLEEHFIKTHISITDIDKEKEKLLGYYYEKTLITPILKYQNQTILDLIYEDDAMSKPLYRYLRDKQLSLFRVKKVKKESFVLFDLFQQKKRIELPLSEDWIGIDKGEIIQGFLYEGETSYLSAYSFTHPKGTEKYILKEVKKRLKNKEEDIEKEMEERSSFLAKLFRKYVNSMRYSGKEPFDIYCLDL